MWAFLSVVVICATILIWSHKYLQPYAPEFPEEVLETEEKVDENKLPNFDKVIQSIYDRLEE